MKSYSEIYEIVNVAIDDAFLNKKYSIDVFDLLKTKNLKKEEVLIILESSLFVSIKHQIEELDEYLSQNASNSFFKESYEWMGLSRASEFRFFLNKILEDAKRYEQSKRRGRKSGSKNKKNSTTTNK